MVFMGENDQPIVHKVMVFDGDTASFVCLVCFSSCYVSPALKQKAASKKLPVLNKRGVHSTISSEDLKSLEKQKQKKSLLP